MDNSLQNLVPGPSHRACQIKRLPNCHTLPKYATEEASGMDLYAAMGGHVVVPAGGHILVKTGVAIQIPYGFEGQVRPRSGLALKHGITVLNSPGTIDSDYRGEIGVILYNSSVKAFVVQPGDRVAQLVFAPVAQIKLQEVSELQDTDRGEGGFGSTGVS